MQPCDGTMPAKSSRSALPVKDDLEKFHERKMASDPEHAIARQLLELGEAVACLREKAGLTCGELGKYLRVKARDIAIVQEETARAPAGLLEAALSFLMQGLGPDSAKLIGGFGVGPTDPKIAARFSGGMTSAAHFHRK